MSAATLRLAFLGPSGTFTESAALRYAPEAELIAAASITAVTASVTEGRADEAIVPIENSLQGSVTETLDLLLHSIELKIRAEIVLAVEHCLIVQPGTPRDAIRSVYSHPQALAQCRGYIGRELPGAERASHTRAARLPLQAARLRHPGRPDARNPERRPDPAQHSRDPGS